MSNGTVPVDYSSPVGRVRALIPDVATADGTENTDYLFADTHLEAYLTIAAGSVYRAAGLAVQAIAGDQALLLKHVRTDDLSVNGAAVADALMKQAKALFTQADEEDSAAMDEAFQVVYPGASECWPEGVQIPVYGRVVGWTECR